MEKVEQKNQLKKVCGHHNVLKQKNWWLIVRLTTDADEYVENRINYIKEKLQ